MMVMKAMMMKVNIDDYNEIDDGDDDVVWYDEYRQLSSP